MFNVITDAGKDKYAFILKSHTTINHGEPVEINRFSKDINQLTISVEKMVDKDDQTIEVLFSAENIEYTLVFNRAKRSDYGTVCDMQQNTIEYRSDLVYIPEANKCFRKCIDSYTKKTFLKKSVTI